MTMPFSPVQAGSVNIAISAASQRVQVFAERGPVSVRIANTSSQTVFIDFGDSTVTASASTGLAIPAGVVEVLTLQNTGNGPLYLAAIGTSTSGNLYLTPGRGA